MFMKNDKIVFRKPLWKSYNFYLEAILFFTIAILLMKHNTPLWFALTFCSFMGLFFLSSYFFVYHHVVIENQRIVIVNDIFQIKHTYCLNDVTKAQFNYSRWSMCLRFYKETKKGWWWGLDLVPKKELKQLASALRDKGLEVDDKVLEYCV